MARNGVLIQLFRREGCLNLELQMAEFGIQCPEADGNSLARGDDAADGVAARQHDAAMIHCCRGCIGRVEIGAGEIGAGLIDELASAGRAGGEISAWVYRCVAGLAELAHRERLHWRREVPQRAGLFPGSVDAAFFWTFHAPGKL